MNIRSSSLGQWLALLALLSFGSASSPSRAATFIEPFSRLDPSLWTPAREGTGLRIRIAQRQLELLLPPTASGSSMKATIASKIPLRGDFDARVEYRLLDWPEASDVKISLGTEVGSVQRVSDSGQGGEVYLTHFTADGVSGNMPTIDRAGKLRLVRAGNQLTAFVFRSSGWTPIHTATLDSITPVHLHLALWSQGMIFARKPARVAFDSLIVRYENRRAPARK